jgi:mitochondrial fission protein ELM1
MLEQINTLAAAAPQRHWVAAGSPRTPASMLAALARLPAWSVVRFEDTNPQWLPARLARAGVVWVSEDSVSMAYEAVSSGAPTGVLEVPARGGHSRVQAATRALLDAGLAIGMSEWRAGVRPRAPQRPLQEADRCARALLERWPALV